MEGNGWKKDVENKTSLERGRMEDLFWRFLEQHTYPGGGFKFLLFSPLLGEMIQFDQYFSNILEPPTRYLFNFSDRKKPHEELADHKANDIRAEQAVELLLFAAEKKNHFRTSKTIFFPKMGESLSVQSKYLDKNPMLFGMFFL